MVRNAALAAVLALFLAGGAGAEDWSAVALSDTTVSFGAVTTGESHSLLLTIINNLAVPVQVTGAAFDEAVFSTDLAGLVPLEIPALGSEDFHVYFELGAERQLHRFPADRLGCGGSAPDSRGLGPGSVSRTPTTPRLRTSGPRSSRTP